MIRFIVRRLIVIPPILFLVNLFGYACAYAAQLFQAQRQAPFSELPEPFASSYPAYLGGLLHFNLGLMPGAGNHDTVAQVLWQASTVSGGLLAIAVTLSIVIGMLVGVSAVRVQPPRISRGLTLFTTVGLASPSFYVGGLFIIGIVYYLLSNGIKTRVPFQGFGWDIHLVLPTLTLMVQPTVQIAQITSGMLVGEIGRQYVVAARSFGVSWRAVRWRHALSNVIAPVILGIAGSLRLLVGELIIVEWLFDWPGLGRLFALALSLPGRLTFSARSPVLLYPPIVAAELMLFALFFMLTDVLASALARAFDPRLH